WLLCVLHRNRAPAGRAHEPARPALWSGRCALPKASEAAVILPLLLWTVGFGPTVTDTLPPPPGDDDAEPVVPDVDDGSSAREVDDDASAPDPDQPTVTTTPPD